MKISANCLCPCGSTKKYKKCCKLFHIGISRASSLELMKSRYCAFFLKDYEYIIKTTHKQNEDYTEDLQSWRDSILGFCNSTIFKSLEIIDSFEKQQEAYVTFKVNLLQEDKEASFIEKSKFFKVNNQWLYHSGVFL